MTDEEKRLFDLWNKARDIELECNRLVEDYANKGSHEVADVFRDIASGALKTQRLLMKVSAQTSLRKGMTRDQVLGWARKYGR